MPAHIRGILLDVDGTLVDSNDAHARAWVAALEQHGHQASFERVRALIGKGGDKLLPEVADVEKDSPEGKRIAESRKQIFKERFLPTLRPFPQARALLERMRRDGLRLVVASSAESGELDALLDAAQVSDLIERKTSSSDAPHSKPDPDIVQAALGQLGEPPEAVLMLGDTPYDVEASARAGVKTIALRCGGWDRPDLAGALAVYDDPADLLARYGESPLA
jgi:HAD superfamily hydrolase (TIGR01509 family)